MNNQRKPRIVIYGAGQFGQYIARFAVQKGWPIVAAFNRAGAKIGQDLGRLSGLGRDIGVVVQDCDSASYDHLDADIGVVTTSNLLRQNMPAYMRLINAGLNVICHGTEAYYPWGCDALLAKEIDVLAKSKGVTFSGSGIWDSSRIWPGIVLAGPCTEIRSLYHSSITNAAQVGKAQMMIAGIGMSVEEFNDRIGPGNPVLRTYKTIPEQVLVALGYTVTADHVLIERVLYEDPIDCPLLERVIPPGECAGTRVVAEIETREGVTAKAVIELRLFREGEIEHMFWAMDGKPATRIRVERDNQGHSTSACLFNRIPDVIAAPPGIVLLSQMGPLKHSALG